MLVSEEVAVENGFSLKISIQSTIDTRNQMPLFLVESLLEFSQILEFVQGVCPFGRQIGEFLLDFLSGLLVCFNIFKFVGQDAVNFCSVDNAGDDVVKTGQWVIDVFFNMWNLLADERHQIQSFFVGFSAENDGASNFF